MAADIVVRPIEPEELDRAIAMLARAFHEDPGALIVEPDEALRPAALTALFAPVVRQAIPFGHVAVAEREGAIVGVATFLPPGHDTPTEDEMVAAGLLEALDRVPAAAERMGPMVDFLEAQHMKAINGPHWRLEFFGVEPGLQGVGIGSRLIRSGHDQADAAGDRVYLETFTRKNVAWYEQRGYAVVIEGVVPGTDIPVWGLIRDPRADGLAELGRGPRIAGC